MNITEVAHAGIAENPNSEEDSGEVLEPRGRVEIMHRRPITRERTYPLFALLSLFGSLLSASARVQASAVSICATVKIEIRQELTLERQAFEARMRIHNGMPTSSLESVDVDVYFTDEQGQGVLATSDPANTAASFFIRLDTKENIDSVDGTGTIAPSQTAEITWLIIPAPGTSNGFPRGKMYFVGARLTYTLKGKQETVEVDPDYIFVKPMPELSLDYFLPRWVYGDDPFTAEVEPVEPFSLGVRVMNNGSGVARNLKIESAQPRIVENEQGLLVDFHIEGSEVNGQTISDSLLVNFGDLAPNSSGTARWIMTASLSGEFVEFTAAFTHADELGGELTSLIEGVDTHELVGDVMVDLPGRDSIRDFLAKDGSVYRVFESDSVDHVVTNQSSSARLELLEQFAGSASYRLSVPVTAGFLYVYLDDPLFGAMALERVVRSDGKNILPENAWLSRTRGDDLAWDSHFQLFDANTTDSYTVYFSVDPTRPRPPQIQQIVDQLGTEGQQISFVVIASDPDGTVPVPSLSATQLPPGATFVDRGNGEGLFDWTPAAGQAGEYEVLFVASDGILQSVQAVMLTVLPAEPEPDVHEPVASAGSTQEILEGSRVVLDGAGSFDEDDDIVGYAWEQTRGTVVELTASAEVQATFTAPWIQTEVEILQFRLTVTDSGDRRSTDLTEVIVYRRGHEPVADAGSNKNVLLGTPVVLDGTESYDPDGDLITFEWNFLELPEGSQLPDEAIEASNSPKTVFTPDQVGDYLVELTVSDEKFSATAEVTFSVAEPNVAPNAEAGRSQYVLTGSSVVLTGGDSEDPDEGPEPLTYLWSFATLPAGSDLDDQSILDRNQVDASFTPDVGGEYELRLTVSDGDLNSEDTVLITTVSANAPPNAWAGDDQVLVLEETAILDGSGSSDPDSPPEALTFRWRFVSVPASSQLTDLDTENADTAMATFVPDVLGVFLLQLRVNDGSNDPFDNVAVSVTEAGDLDEDGIEDRLDNCPTVANPDQLDSNEDGTGDACVLFIRGDGNTDGDVDVSDGIFILSYLFLGGEEPKCQKSGDANLDAFVDISDGIYVLAHLFLGGPPMPPPYPDCGLETCPDDAHCDLPCKDFSPCQ